MADGVGCILTRQNFNAGAELPQYKSKINNSRTQGRLEGELKGEDKGDQKNKSVPFIYC